MGNVMGGWIAPPESGGTSEDKRRGASRYGAIEPRVTGVTLVDPARHAVVSAGKGILRGTG